MGGPETVVGEASRAVDGKRVSAAERRGQYLDVAADLVTSSGAEAVTMEAVAAGANVNKALLYRQFSNRNELLLTLYEQESGELDRRLLEAMEGLDDFEERVRAWVHAWFSYMGRRGTLYYRLVDAARTIASSTAERPHRERQRRIVASHAAAYAKHFGLEADEAADASAILFSGLNGAIERWVASPTATTRRRLESIYVDSVLGTLQRVASHPKPANGGGRSRKSTNGKSSRPR